MIEKILFICLIIFNSQRLIRSDFKDEFDLISWQKNVTPKRESVAFIDTQYFYFDDSRTTKEEDIDLFECKDEANGAHCQSSEVEFVDCINLNYQNSDFPKWQCKYVIMLPIFFVTSFEITCENPVPSQQPPTHYNVGTCFLSFTLKVNKTVATFKETSYLVFNKLEQTKGKIPIPQLKCIDDSSDDLCTKSTVEQANCTNLFYQSHYFAYWDCKFMVLNPGFSIKKNNVNCESPDGSKTESYPQYYKKETCSLEYTLYTAKSPEHDKKADEKLPEKDHTLQILCIVLGALFVVCMFIVGYFRFCQHPG